MCGAEHTIIEETAIEERRAREGRDEKQMQETAAEEKQNSRSGWETGREEKIIKYEPGEAKTETGEVIRDGLRQERDESH